MTNKPEYKVSIVRYKLLKALLNLEAGSCIEAEVKSRVI
jgi:hypothetical protein